MGFPVGYTEVFIPTLFIHTLTFFTAIRNLLHHLFTYIGLSDFLEPPPPPQQQQTTTTTLGPTPLSAILTRELLPIARVSHDQHVMEERCAICLYEFDKGEEFRWLCNCNHIFHMDCLDRWMDLDHRTCPLCRTPFLLDDLLHEFNQRLLEANHHINHHSSDHFQYVDHYNYSYHGFSSF